MRLMPFDIRKIAIFRALQLGDLLCAIPAIRSLSYAYPDAEITLVGLPWARSLIDRYPQYFDRFIHFPGYPGLPEQPYSAKQVKEFVAQMQQQRFDLLLQMQGDGSIVNRLLSRCDARWMAGFSEPGRPVFSELFITYPKHLSEVHRHLALMQHLGLPSRGDYLEFPLTDKDRREAEQLMMPLIPGRYICVHPGSRGAWRQWPPACFAALADRCIEAGYTVVLTGTEAESGITTEVKKRMKHPALDLTGKTTLGSIAWIIKHAYALIANCTGVSHLAAAVRTRSLIISMDGEPERWSPPDSSLHKVIDGSKSLQFEQMFLATLELIKAPVESVL
jgi:ADP-heptose:LPS heptosyltransferase